MVKRPLTTYGEMVVGQHVLYVRLEKFSGKEPVEISSEHIIKAIYECGNGALLMLKGTAATIVKGFDSAGLAWDGFGSLQKCAISR